MRVSIERVQAFQSWQALASYDLISTGGLISSPHVSVIEIKQYQILQTIIRINKSLLKFNKESYNLAPLASLKILFEEFQDQLQILLTVENELLKKLGKSPDIQHERTRLELIEQSRKTLIEFTDGKVMTAIGIQNELSGSIIKYFNFLNLPNFSIGGFKEYLVKSLEWSDLKIFFNFLLPNPTVNSTQALLKNLIECKKANTAEDLKQKLASFRENLISLQREAERMGHKNIETKGNQLLEDIGQLLSTNDEESWSESLILLFGFLFPLRLDHRSQSSMTKRYRFSIVTPNDVDLIKPSPLSLFEYEITDKILSLKKPGELKAKPIVIETLESIIEEIKSLEISERDIYGISLERNYFRETLTETIKLIKLNGNHPSLEWVDEILASWLQIVCLYELEES